MSKLRVVRLDNQYNSMFLTGGEGDPGRTYSLDFAKLFETKSKAEKFRLKTIKDNSHMKNLESNLRVVNVGMYLIE